MNDNGEKYDAALLLGAGITADGALPESSAASVKKAAELYQQKRVKYIVTCGKWSYATLFTPPVTEARALGQALIAQGVPAEVIFTEDQSVSTMRQAVEKEKARIQEAQRFLGTLPKGDHKTILQAATADLHKNWLPKIKHP